MLIAVWNQIKAIPNLLLTVFTLEDYENSPGYSDVMDSRLPTVLRNTNEVPRLLRNLRAVLHGDGGPQIGEVTCRLLPIVLA